MRWLLDGIAAGACVILCADDVQRALGDLPSVFGSSLAWAWWPIAACWLTAGIAIVVRK